ncbi:putative RNA recognition motif domain, nucleotide-binding alpha-beta plait domain superfamily [Helianthus annuus]|nr:putative RNA recognition motif domain, nucleotide-binding alpha-beta plait domain superfamily [Helianthus annuus]
MEEEQPWNQVIGKRKQKRNQRRTKKLHFEFENATTFFVSNLPGYCTREELWQEFRVFGNLKDVFIPRKFDKGGSRFAFVRYEDVKDSGKLLEVLNKIKIKNAKLLVDMARFRRDGLPFSSDKHEGSKPPPANTPFQRETYTKTNQGFMEHGGTRSYSDVVMGDRSGKQKVVEFHGYNSKTIRAWEGTALMVEAKSFEILCNMNDIIGNMHQFLSGMRYIGGLRVLLTFNLQKHCEAFLNHYQERQSKWFSSIKPWLGNEGFVDRIAWLRIEGVPIHAWDKDTFDMIARTFGVVISPSGATVKDCNLSYEMVGILVNSGREVKEEMEITWNGDVHKIWISEVLRDWIPDFLIGSSGIPKRSIEKEGNIVMPETVVHGTPATGKANTGVNEETGEGRSFPECEQSNTDGGTCNNN